MSITLYVICRHVCKAMKQCELCILQDRVNELTLLTYCPGIKKYALVCQNLGAGLLLHVLVYLHMKNVFQELFKLSLNG